MIRSEARIHHNFLPSDDYGLSESQAFLFTVSSQGRPYQMNNVLTFHPLDNYWDA